MGKDLNILVQSSDHYAPIAGVMLTSLFENNKEQDDIIVYLLTSDMSAENRLHFELLAKQYQRTVKFFDTTGVDYFLKDNCVPKFRNSYATYYRIFALSLIPEQMDRLIYLDSDMVITGSLAELSTCDLGNNVAGMCIDKLPERYKKLINCDSQLYYNAGMIVFDVKKWAAERCTDRVMNHIQNVCSAYPYVDQDLINVVCSGKIATLPQKYNFDAEILWHRGYKYYKKSYGLKNYYSEQEFNLAKTNPAVIHCLPVFSKRPWFIGDYPVKEMWKHYLEMSPWNDYVYTENATPFVHRVQYFLYKYTPSSLFSVINEKCFNMSLWIQVRNMKRRIQKSIKNNHQTTGSNKR